MKLRVARHTKDLQPLINFYTNILGFETIGEFKDHNNYDGVFIGDKNTEWHLEFTVSKEVPNHHTDEDDLLVFYTDSPDQFNKIKGNIAVFDIKLAEPKNPYWKDNGITIIDPDGFRIVIVKPEDEDWGDLPEEAIEGIKEGLADIEAGRVYTHEEVMAYIDKKIADFRRNKSI